MNEIIFTALKLIVMILAAVCARYLIPELKTIMASDKYKLIQSIAETAVYSAQQLLYAKSGEERKAYAVDYIQSTCQKYGVTITDDQIDALIESAVRQLRLEEAS